MCKPDGLARCSEEEKSEMEAYFFNEGQLLNLKNNYIRDEEDLEDVELEGIDIPTWKRKNWFSVVLQEHRLEVLRQHHDGPVV